MQSNFSRFQPLEGMARLRARDELSRQIHATLSPQKRDQLGQVLTPPNVADFMARIMARKVPGSFVDAGAGYGMLSDASGLRGVVMSPNHAKLVDLDEHMARFLRTNNPLPGSSVLQTDFVTWSLAADPVDYVVANPPYLKHDNYDTGLVDSVNQALGSQLSKLTNLFALFLLCGARLLKPSGRLVCIIPTEIFTTNYGKKTLASIPKHAHITEVHVFGPHNEPFKAACTTSCIVVLDADEPPSHVRVHEVVGGDDEQLTSRLVDEVPWATVLESPKRVVNGVLHRNLEGFVPLGELMQVSRGMSTGDNGFFLLDEDRRKHIDPEGRFTQRVWKNALDGTRYLLTAEDHEDLVMQGHSRWLLRVPDYDSAPASVQAYLDEGRRMGLPERNVCSNRTPWFKQESHTPGRLLLGAMYRGHCRAILNPDAISTLTCFHRAVDRAGSRLTDDELLILTSWLNTKAGQDSIREVSRRYGSGMFVLVPSDAGSIMVPDVRGASLDAETRAGLTAALRACDGPRLAALLAARKPD